MQDAQGPTDAEDGAGDAPRRAGLRLRDAEAVATVRRDMFGDGSLLDSLAGSPPAPERAGSSPDPSAAPPSAPPGDVGAGHAEAPRQADAAEAASQAGPGPMADMAQSLDAIIDSFPAEPVADAPGEEPAPDAGSAIAALQMGIASLFDSLGSIGPRAGETVQPVEEPPPPSAPTLELDMSMLERSPTRPALPPQGGPPAAALRNGASPPFMVPGYRAHEAQVDEAQVDEAPVDEAPVDEAPVDEAKVDEAQADDAQTGEVEAVELDLDMSMLERPTVRAVLQPDSGAGSPYGDLSPPIETDQRGVEEPAIETPAEPDALTRYPDEPSLGDVGGSSPSDFADPLHALPLRERLARPAFAEPSDLAYAPRFAEPMDPPGFPEPQVLPAYAEPLEGEAQPMFDAADKIAAEAQATAAVLDNLRGLLAHGTPNRQEPIELPDHDPDLDLGRTTGHAHVRYNLRGDPTQFPSSGPAALMPMPLPVPPDRRSTRSIYVLGFLTGLGLSLIAGIALYVLINMA